MLFKLGQQDLVEDRVLAIDMAVHQLTDAGQRLVRLQAIGTGLFTGEGDLLLQARDTNFEKLIQVAGKDQQKFQAFKQRVGLVQRLLQHANIELQLRQLAMNIQAAVIKARHNNRRMRRRVRLGHGGRGLLRYRRGFWNWLGNRLSFSGNDFCKSFGIH